MRVVSVFIIVSSTILGGCVSTEAVRFSPQSSQNTIIRDGQPALVSKKKNSIVLLAPAHRQLQAGTRPVFVVGVTNLTKVPFDLHVSNITVTQMAGGRPLAALPVVTYEQLVSEERTRQVVRAVLVGAAAAGNAYSASRAGYGSASGTVYSPYGSRTVSMNYYDPTAAAIAQTNAAIANDAMIGSAIEAGQRNLSTLETTVLKDNTVMPGEWIGGQLHFAPPQSVEGGAPKEYQIDIRLGDETHSIVVSQGPAGS